MEMATEAPAAAVRAPRASQAAERSLECVKGIRTSLRAFKRDVALSFRFCSRDFGLLGSELLEALQKRERMASMALEYERSTRRRAQHKALETHGGAIRVLCKVRPLLALESSATSETTARVTVPTPHEVHVAKPAMPTSSLDSALVSLHSPPTSTSIRSYSFERVFTDESTHAQVYKEIQPLVMAAMDGQHACVFAYGQTGSGKTHSIYGSTDSDEDNENERGLAWRAAETIFETVREQKALFEFSVTLRMVEIYNEEMYDLLAAEEDATSASNSSGEGPSLLVVPFQTIHNGSTSGPNFVSKRPVGEIRHGEDGVFLRNVESVAVRSAEDVVHAMERGEINRAVHQSSNSDGRRGDHSSRSHCVVLIDIQRCGYADGHVENGRFVLVDLAGSERLIRSETSGLRLREAQHINKSLAALEDVLVALLAKDKHVPYRNTKLTHLLQDSLGGTHSQTLMLVHVSPSSKDVAETVSTLKFASRVNKKQLKHKKRSEDQEMHRLRGMVASQGTQLQALQDKLTAELELRRKYEKRLEEYRQEENRRKAKDDELRSRSTPDKSSPEMLSPDQLPSSTSSTMLATPSKNYGPPSHQQSTVSSSRLPSTPEQPQAKRRWSLYNRKDTFKSSGTAGHTPRVAKHSTAGGQENISENIPRGHRSSAVHKLPPVPEKSSTYGMSTPVRRTRRASLMPNQSERKALRSPLRVAATQQQHTGTKRKMATPSKVRSILKKQRLSLDPQAVPPSSTTSIATSGGSSDLSGKQVSFDLSSRMAAATRVGGVHLMPTLSGGANGVSTSSALPPRMPKSMLRTPMAASRVPAPPKRTRISMSSPPGLASPMPRVRASQSPSKRKWNGGWR